MSFVKELGTIPRRLFNKITTNLSLRTGVNLSKPSYVCAQMTMKCNSRCVHCDIWRNDYKESELSTERWLYVLGELRRWLGEFSMVFTGGEALLRPDMVSLLKYAAGLGISVELLTNGLIVDDALARQIVAAGLSQVTISYDGGNAETFDRFRGEIGFHARTTEALLALSKHRNSMKKPLKILLKTVVSSNNINELADVAVFASLHSFNVRYQPIEENYAAITDPEWYKKSLLWIHDNELLRSQFEKLKQMKALGYPIDNSTLELDRYVRYFERPEELMSEIRSHEVGLFDKGCLPAVSSFVISCNGDVRMCSNMEPIGNLAVSGPEEIWRERKRCWVRNCEYR